MTDIQQKTLEKWRTDFKVILRGHYDAAVACGRLNRILGIPVVILSAVVGTSIFSALALKPDDIDKILVGFVSIITSVLAALQTFLGFSERAEKHRVAGAKFAAMYKEVDQMIACPPATDELFEKELTSLRTRWDALAENSPTIPRAIWARNVKVVQKVKADGQVLS